MTATRLIALLLLARLIADLHGFAVACRSVGEGEEVDISICWIPLVLYREDGDLFVEIGVDRR